MSFGLKKLTDSWGNKVENAVQKGVKQVPLGTIADVSSTVSKVAGIVAPIAAMTGLEPIAAAAVGVSAAASKVSSVAQAADTSRKLLDDGTRAIDQMRSGHPGQAFKSGKAAVADSKKLRKQIQR
jgi:hypothetical protein